MIQLKFEILQYRSFIFGFLFLFYLKTDEAMKVKNTDIAKELCLPPVKLHCSSNITKIFNLKIFYQNFLIKYIIIVLAEDAIKAAVSDYAKKRKGSVKQQMKIANVETRHFIISFRKAFQ